MFWLANAWETNSCDNDGGSTDWTEVLARTAFHKQGYPEQCVFIRDRYHGGVWVDADHWVLRPGGFRQLCFIFHSFRSPKYGHILVFSFFSFFFPECCCDVSV